MEAGEQAGIGNKDPRRLFYAYSKNLLPPIPIEADLFGIPSRFAVFEAACTSIEKETSETVILNQRYETISYTIEWEVIDSLALHPSYQVPKALLTTITTSYDYAYSQIEQGKRYLIAGEVRNIPKLNETKAPPVSFIFFRATDGSIPCIPLKDGISAGDFLNSKDGGSFRQLVNNCILLVNSVNVITTNDLDSVLHFNLRRANIIKGRKIMPEEYGQGNRVCFVSSELAEYNNINIGDFITLTLANASCRKLNLISGTFWYPVADPFSIQYSSEEQFEVVGIYRTPEWKNNEYALFPNTIFIPSRSVSSINISQPIQDNTQMDYDYPPILYSIVIPNNRLETFKESVKQTGLGQYFSYYDQGYSYVSMVLETLMQNAIILFCFCVAAGVFVWILFILLYIMKDKYTTGVMLYLGTETKKCFAYLFISSLLLIILSSLCSAVISDALEEKVTKYSHELAMEQCAFNDDFSDMKSESLNYNLYTENSDTMGKNTYNSLDLNPIKTAALCSVLQSVILVIAGAVSIFSVLRKNPMLLMHSKEV
ncbi:MAG TPA: hypothetical protein GXX49_10810 [Clostridiaceae bacterium]|nr:hypothetical protein [Clostridiaceae bacterium]